MGSARCAGGSTSSGTRHWRRLQPRSKPATRRTKANESHSHHRAGAQKHSRQCQSGARVRGVHVRPRALVAATHTIGKPPMQTAVLELRLGGRWYELSADGSQADVGKVLVWEPPQRFVISWDLNSNWKPDTTVSSEVEVRFIAQGPQATLVELEHRNFERLGAEAGASMRKDVDGGWPGMLEHFKQEAEASGRSMQAAGRAG